MLLIVWRIEKKQLQMRRTRHRIDSPCVCHQSSYTYRRRPAPPRTARQVRGGYFESERRAVLLAREPSDTLLNVRPVQSTESTPPPCDEAAAASPTSPAQPRSSGAGRARHRRRTGGARPRNQPGSGQQDGLRPQGCHQRRRWDHRLRHGERSRPGAVHGAPRPDDAGRGRQADPRGGGGCAEAEQRHPEVRRSQRSSGRRHDAAAAHPTRTAAIKAKAPAAKKPAARKPAAKSAKKATNKK